MPYFAACAAARSGTASAQATTSKAGKRARIAEIPVADVAAADEPDPHRVLPPSASRLPPHPRAAQSIPRRTSSRASGTSKSAATWPSEQ